MAAWRKKPGEHPRGSKATITLTLYATLGCLTLLTVAALGWKSASSWAVYQASIDQKAFNRDVNRFVAGLHEVVLERIVSSKAIHLAEPANAAVLAAIAAHRAAAEHQLTFGLAALERWDFPNKAALIQEFKALAPKADHYRRQVDEAIGRPRDQRDQSLRNLTTPPTIDLVGAGVKIWFVLIHSNEISDRHLTRLAFIKEIGWRMRGAAGRERAIVAAAVAERGFGE